MPRYTFTIQDGGPVHDPIEAEFPSVAAARTEAARTAGEVLKALRQFSGQEWRIDVADEGGTPVITVRFCAEEHA